MKIVNSLVGAAMALSLLLGAEAARAECMKWVVPLAVCEVVPSGCQNPTQAQLRSYYDVIHTETPDDGCYNWGIKGYGDLRGNAERVSDDTYYCYLDENENGIFDDPTFTVIFYQTIQREWCCEAQVEGPHADLTPDVWYMYLWYNGQKQVVAVPPDEGLAFTSQTLYSPQGEPYLGQTTRVRAENAIGTVFRSDLNNGYRGSLDYWSTLDPTSFDWRRRPQVDHIIPRKDIKGCDCGANSFKNALLISAQLNNEMSNFCGNPPGQADDPGDPAYAAIQKRKAIIAAFPAP